MKSSLVVELGSIRGNHPHAGLLPSRGRGGTPPPRSYFDWAQHERPIPPGFRLGGRDDGEGVHLHAGRPPHPAHTSTGLSTSGPSPLDSDLHAGRPPQHELGPLTLDSGSGAGMTGEESTFTLVVPPTPLILRRGSRHRRIFDSTSGPTHPGFRLGGRDDGGGVHLHAGRPPHPAHTSTGLPPQADLRQHERAHSPWIPVSGAE